MGGEEQDGTGLLGNEAPILIVRPVLLTMCSCNGDNVKVATLPMREVLLKCIDSPVRERRWFER